MFFPAMTHFVNTYSAASIKRNTTKYHYKAVKKCRSLFVVGLFVCLFDCLFAFVCLFISFVFFLFCAVFVFFRFVLCALVFNVDLLFKYQSNDKIVSTL